MKQFLLASLATGVLLVAACGGDNATTAPSEAAAATTEPGESMSASAGPGADLVGVALPTDSSEEWTRHGESLAALLAEAGYASDVRYAEDTVSVQVSQIEDMIEAGAKALVIAAVDAASLTDVLQAADEAGIGVLAYGRLIRDTAAVDYYTTFDPFHIGVLQAQSIVDALDLRTKAGPFSIELFGGAPDDPDAGPILEGALSVLQPLIDAGKLIVASGETLYPEQIGTIHWSGGTAQARMDNLLHAYYGDRRVDAVLSPKDAMTRGIIASLRQAGYYTAEKPGPAVTGQDAEILSVQSILAGEQTSTVFRDTRSIAARAASIVDQMLTGGTVDVNDRWTYDNGVTVVPSFLLDGVSVTRDNVRPVLLESGYYTVDELQ